MLALLEKQQVELELCHLNLVLETRKMGLEPGLKEGRS